MLRKLKPPAKAIPTPKLNTLQEVLDQLIKGADDSGRPEVDVPFAEGGRHRARDERSFGPVSPNAKPTSATALPVRPLSPTMARFVSRRPRIAMALSRG
jgi:hypothetical protein